MSVMAETISVCCDPNIKQIQFALGDLNKALARRDFQAVSYGLDTFPTRESGPCIVLAVGLLGMFLFGVRKGNMGLRAI